MQILWMKSFFYFWRNVAMNKEMNCYRKHFLEWWNCQDSEASNRLDFFPIESYFTMLIFSVESLMEEIKPVVTEKIQFEYRDKPIFSVLAFLGHFWKTRFSHNDQIQSFINSMVHQRLKVSNGSSMDEIKQVIMMRKI